MFCRDALDRVPLGLVCVLLPRGTRSRILTMKGGLSCRDALDRVHPGVPTATMGEGGRDQARPYRALILFISYSLDPRRVLLPLASLRLLHTAG